MRSFSEEPLRIESTKFTFLRLKGTRRRKKVRDLPSRGGGDFFSPPPHQYLDLHLSKVNLDCQFEKSVTPPPPKIWNFKSHVKNLDRWPLRP